MATAQISRGWINFDWQFESLLKDLQTKVQNIDRLLPEGVDEFGDVMIEAIRFFVPIVTGETAASIGKFSPDLLTGAATPQAYMRARAAGVYRIRRLSSETYEVVVGSNSDRVVYMNYGTRHNPAHYAFERGGAMAAQYFKPIIEAVLQTSLRASGSTPSGSNRVQRLTTGAMPVSTANRIASMRSSYGRTRITVS